jgi:hypothetical protein
MQTPMDCSVSVAIAPKRGLVFPLFFLLNFFAIAQKPTANIVPNPSFERFASAPIGWSYKGAYFGEVVKYWFSATTASPDIYGPDVHVPMDWADKGFGDQKPERVSAWRASPFLVVPMENLIAANLWKSSWLSLW